MARLLTRSQYARRGWRDPQTGDKIKYTRQRITQLVNQGVISLKGDKIDPAQADIAIAANIDRSRRIKEEKKRNASKTPQLKFSGNGFNTEPKTSTSSNGFNTDPLKPTLTDTRRDHELLKMKKTELEIKQKKSQLVPKEEATKWVIAIGSAVKLAFLGLPRRLAPILKTIQDENEIEILLRSEIQRIIHDLLEQPLHAKHKRPRRKNPKRSLADHLETSR